MPSARSASAAVVWRRSGFSDAFAASGPALMVVSMSGSLAVRGAVVVHARVFLRKIYGRCALQCIMKMKRRWQGYAWAVGATAICTLAGFAMYPRFDLVNIAMVYLVAVVIVALRFSRGPAIAASVLCVAAFDFLFVPPRGTFTVDDAQYLLTFAIMLAVALVISRLVESVRRQAAAQATLEIEAETERIRSTLLASISHDLRTPLAIMAGASSSLAESGERIDAPERRALAESVFEQAQEMSEHVAKILQMTRLETGAIKVDRDWAALGEIIGSVLARLPERLTT